MLALPFSTLISNLWNPGYPAYKSKNWYFPVVNGENQVIRMLHSAWAKPWFEMNFHHYFFLISLSGIASQIVRLW